MIKIALLAGARPNYMKIYPLWRDIAANHPEVVPVIIHTGQHYDRLMSDVFFQDLGLPAPDFFLGVGSGSHGRQTGKTMIALEPVLEANRPDLLVLVGDVNSTVAGAMVGVKMGIPVAHVEAGLRSFDRTMPEEINRLATDAISDILLTSCRDGDVNLKREGIPESRIHFVGNVMIDSLLAMLASAGKSTILASLGLEEKTYACITLHRPSNVDRPERFKRIMDGLMELSSRMPVVFPMHPRTRQQFEQMDGTGPNGNLRIIDPLSYLDFLRLMSASSVVVTDSGGIQEETSFLGIPCRTIRPNTERPITITEGTNRLLDMDRTSMAEEVTDALENRPVRPSIEGWDGKAGSRVVRVLLDQLQKNV